MLGSGIGAGDSYLRDPHAESRRYFAPGKMLDSAILRLKSRSSPVTVSTGRTPLRKISKAVAPRDANRVFGSFFGRWV